MHSSDPYTALLLGRVLSPAAPEWETSGSFAVLVPCFKQQWQVCLQEDAGRGHLPPLTMHVQTEVMRESPHLAPSREARRTLVCGGTLTEFWGARIFLGVVSRFLVF